MNDRSLAVEGQTLPAPYTPAVPDLDDAPGPAARIGVGAAILFFVIFLGWAAFARLDAAAIGMGQVSVAGNRQIRRVFHDEPQCARAWLRR